MDSYCVDRSSRALSLGPSEAEAEVASVPFASSLPLAPSSVYPPLAAVVGLVPSSRLPSVPSAPAFSRVLPPSVAPYLLSRPFGVSLTPLAFPCQKPRPPCSRCECRAPSPACSVLLFWPQQCHGCRMASGSSRWSQAHSSWRAASPAARPPVFQSRLLQALSPPGQAAAPNISPPPCASAHAQESLHLALDASAVLRPTRLLCLRPFRGLAALTSCALHIHSYHCLVGL